MVAKRVDGPFAFPMTPIVTFRLTRPLDMGGADRGVMRDGRHYHDYDNPDRDR